MKPFHVWVLMLCLGLGCATSARVRSETSPGVNLAVYKTFTLTTHPADPQEPLKTEISRRIETEMTTQLVAHGLQETSNHPDLVFTYQNDRRTRTDSGGSGNGLSDEGWTYQEGAIEVTATDPVKAETVWTAHAQAVIDPQDKAHVQIKRAMEDMFRRYPMVTARS